LLLANGREFPASGSLSSPKARCRKRKVPSFGSGIPQSIVRAGPCPAPSSRDDASSHAALQVPVHRSWATRKPRCWPVRKPGDLVALDIKRVRPVCGVLLRHFSARYVVSRWDVPAGLRTGYLPGRRVIPRCMADTQALPHRRGASRPAAARRSPKVRADLPIPQVKISRPRAMNSLAARRSQHSLDNLCPLAACADLFLDPRGVESAARSWRLVCESTQCSSCSQ
jgi:hypothetical protein